jgi:hypothetical protein
MIGPVPDKVVAIEAPPLSYVFSAAIELGAPIEIGIIDGNRERFIPILGGAVYGPRLTGIVLSAAGDWQIVRGDGRTDLLARYFLQASDGTVITIENPGMRVAPPEIIERMACGEVVSSTCYYSGGSPKFRVAAGLHDWLRKSIFFARGVRLSDSLTIDFYTVD